MLVHQGRILFVPCVEFIFDDKHVIDISRVFQQKPFADWLRDNGLERIAANGEETAEIWLNCA
jgi:hypothetical protein